MSLEGTRKEHLSDEELIVVLYRGELTDPHVADCLVCRQRLAAFRANREKVEQGESAAWDVSSDRLAAQRRNIYARLSRPAPAWLEPWQSSLKIIRLVRPKWISVGAAGLALCGGLLVFQSRHGEVRPEDKISDVELAQEVSSLSQSAEALPTEPLKALFE